MRIGFTVAAYGRHDLLRRVLKYTKTIMRPGDRLVVVGSEPLPQRMCGKLDIEYVDHPNQPLGAKRNAGIQPLRGEVDAVCILNSDDFISPVLLARYRVLLNAHRAVGLEGLVFRVQELGGFRVWTKYRELHRRRAGIGPGRVLRTDVLDAIDWKPWQDDLPKGLDNSVAKRIGCPIHLLPIDGTLGLVDVKTSDEVITSWQATEKVAERVYEVAEEDLPFRPGTFYGL